MDIIGILYGTDKSFIRNDYLSHYERLFFAFTDRVFNLIEIGVQDGASLRMWQAYFQKAIIVGVDISPNCARHASERIRIEVGSQADAQFLATVAGKYPPTIVIDDGSHRADHQIFSFERLFPTLAEGGLYVVEDLTANQRSRGSSAIPSTEYFGHLLSGVMTRWETPVNGAPKWAPAAIESAYAMPGAIAFRKRARAEAPTNLALIEDLVARSGVPKAWSHFAWYLENRVQALDKALAAAERGADLEPKNPWMQLRIASICLKLGKRESALEAARRAHALGPDEIVFRDFLHRLETPPAS